MTSIKMLHRQEGVSSYLHTRLLPPALGALDGVASLAATVVAISIGLAAVKLRQRFMLVAAPTQLDRTTRWRLFSTVITLDQCTATWRMGFHATHTT